MISSHHTSRSRHRINADPTTSALLIPGSTQGSFLAAHLDGGPAGRHHFTICRNTRAPGRDQEIPAPPERPGTATVTLWDHGGADANRIVRSGFVC
jgi:hypothetical protein